MLWYRSSASVWRPPGTEPASADGAAARRAALVDERLQLRDQLIRTPKRKARVDAVVPRPGAELLEPPDLGLPNPSKRKSANAGPRQSASASERSPSARAESPASSALRPSPRAARSARCRARPTRPAAGSPAASSRSGPAPAWRAAGRRRFGGTSARSRAGGPAKLVDQRVGRDRLAGVDEKHRQEAALPPAPDRHRPAVAGRLEPAEDTELHTFGR